MGPRSARLRCWQLEKERAEGALLGQQAQEEEQKEEQELELEQQGGQQGEKVQKQLAAAAGAAASGAATAPGAAAAGASAGGAPAGGASAAGASAAGGSGSEPLVLMARVSKSKWTGLQVFGDDNRFGVVRLT